MRRALFLSLCLCLPAQVVQESFPVDPGPLDFIHGEGSEQAMLQALTGDALVGLRPDGTVVPRLAARWRSTKDGLRFELRSDARFTDGSAVTAADAGWTLQQLQSDPKASPTRKALLTGEAFSEEGGALVIRSAKPAARLLVELARIPIAKQGHPDLGSGPFLLKRQGGEWELTRRDHFLHPSVEGLHFRLIADSNGVLQALQKGWLSLGVPPPRAGLKTPGAFAQLVEPTHAQLIVWSRMDLGVLQALERWRKDAFPAQLLGEGIRPSRGLWPESLGFEPVSIAAPPRSCPKELDLIYAGGDAPVEKLLLALAERAKQDGVVLHLKPLEPGLLVERLVKGDFQLICALNQFDPSPWSVLGYLESGGELNFTQWSSPELAALLPKLDASHAVAWHEAQQLWARNPAALPLLDYRAVLWVDRKLKVEASPMGLYLTTPGPAGWTWAP